MKIIQNLLKDERDVFLVNTTAVINQNNPIVDRMMDCESVDGVILANKEGLPILTNINVPVATRYTTRMKRLGVMVHHLVMEMDPFDEPLVLRIKTRKEELLVAPHREFNIVVVQRDKKPKEPAHSIRESKRVSEKK